MTCIIILTCAVFNCAKTDYTGPYVIFCRNHQKNDNSYPQKALLGYCEYVSARKSAKTHHKKKCENALINGYAIKKTIKTGLEVRGKTDMVNNGNVSANSVSGNDAGGVVCASIGGLDISDSVKVINRNVSDNGKSRGKAKNKEVELRWRIKERWQGREELARQLGVSPLVAQLLYNRGVRDAETGREFLEPALRNLFPPEMLVGIGDAVARIRQAISEGEKIVIYGDYDVDGITGVSILWRCFELGGVEVDYYVPHRVDEGYGLNVQAIEYLAKKGVGLIITVDCGVTAYESARRAAELGVDLIITDHHKVDDVMAEAVAVVHPDLPGQEYANPYLCGAGVAFKLAWALAQEFSGAKKVTQEFRDFLCSATSLAALGTIADIVPLVGENRIFACFGLQSIAVDTNIGIKALIESAGLTGSALKTTDIGFKLAPRLNAAGRMGHARLAVELFTCSSTERARQIAEYLTAQNRQRQKVEKEITEQAFAQVLKLGMDKDGYNGIVVAGENWHAGVIGIVASRIVDKFHRPAIVISLQEDKAMGSGRSIKGFDLYEAIAGCRDMLSGFGGHAMAAGITLTLDKVNEFREAFNTQVGELINEEQFVQEIVIDAEVELAELTVPVMKVIERTGPFGQGNPKVMLVARGLRLVDKPGLMGKKGDHLQMMVTDKDIADAHQVVGGIMRVVGFGKGKWLKKLQNAERFDLVFEPSLNHFNGNTTVEMIAQDISINN